MNSQLPNPHHAIIINSLVNTILSKDINVFQVASTYHTLSTYCKVNSQQKLFAKAWNKIGSIIINSLSK